LSHKRKELTEIKEYIRRSKAIAWDGCHKIYVLMDDEQVTEMEGYGYEGDFLIKTHGKFVDDVLAIVKHWYDESCGLRFIEAVSTNHEDSNAGFTSLIAQFEFTEYANA